MRSIADKSVRAPLIFMNKRTHVGLEILLVALVMGLLGNFLLRETPWGLNAFVFVAAFTGGMIFIAWRHRPELLTVRTLALQAAMVFFGSMFVLRDAIELKIYDTIAILIIMGILMLPNFNINQRFAGVFHYMIGFIWSGISSAFGAFFVMGADVQWAAMPGNRISKSLFSVLRGVAIALPLLLIFGALFMAADAAFENFANRIINFDLELVISNVILTSALAWLTAGYLRGTLVEHFANTVAEPIVSPIPKNDVSQNEERSNFVKNMAKDTAAESGPLPENATVLEHINRSDPPNADIPAGNDWNAGIPAGNESEARKNSDAPNQPKKRDWQNFNNSNLPQVFTLGKVETIIILGLVNVLFLSFVIFQLPYLFGGMDMIQATPDLKLADYARRGFGEIVFIAFLVLPMLLLSHWLLRRNDAKNEVIFRIFAGVQIILLFVIMASAMQRLVLLTGNLGYGWTEVRFYPMVFMIWLSLVFVWFGWTVLRGNRNNFAWGALWSAIVILGATNLMNPHDFIARKNIQLMQQGRDFDVYFHRQLSFDAVPIMLENLNTMSAEDQCFVISKLRHDYDQLKSETDLRSFNIARRSALTAFRVNDSVINQAENCYQEIHGH